MTSKLSNFELSKLTPTEVYEYADKLCDQDPNALGRVLYSLPNLDDEMRVKLLARVFYRGGKLPDFNGISDEGRADLMVKLVRAGADPIRLIDEQSWLFETDLVKRSTILAIARLHGNKYQKELTVQMSVANMPSAFWDEVYLAIGETSTSAGIFRGVLKVCDAWRHLRQKWDSWTFARKRK